MKEKEIKKDNSRVLKFRAWDGEQMLYWGFVSGRDMFTGPASSKGGNPFTMPQMQFTGLLDKNGKEIYEGDIVKTIDRIMEMKYEKIATASIGFRLVHPKHGYWAGIGAIEIIGNIYENPDLIK